MNHYPKLVEDGDCFRATVGEYRTAKYVSKEGALKALCERIGKDLETALIPPFVATGPCNCEGWGSPAGCRGCGLRCMGG